MKYVRSLAVALAMGGLAASAAVAATPGGYPMTGRFATPALLPQQESPPPTGYAVAPGAFSYGTPASTISARTVRQESVPPGAPAIPTPADPSAAPIPPEPGGDFEQAIQGCGNCEGCADVCLPTCCPRWFGYVGGLVMTRDRSNKMWTTYETGNNPNQLMYFPGADWAGGAEVRFGSFIGCGCTCAWEATYWGVWGMTGNDSRLSPTNQLSTPIDLGFVDIVAPGSPASLIFDNASEHRLRREDNFHNVEINFLNYPLGGYNVNGPVRLSYLAGVRYFRLEEMLQFTSVRGGSVFGANAGLDQASLNLDMDNNLVGGQLGGRADWFITPSWLVFAAPKVGLFANYMNFDTQLTRGDGAVATFASTGNPFNLHASKTDVSFLAQIDLGTQFQVSRHCGIEFGYRAVAITGVALADDQIPPFLAAEDDWRDIDSNGSMILHGAFAGLTFNW